MQKLSVSEDEQMSRKEYLKNKKKQEKSMNSILGKFTKKRIIVAVMSIALLAYVGVQFYIYYKRNSYNYLSDEEVDSQKVYEIYYMSDGYTYNPSSSLNTIKSNSFDLNRIYTDLGFEQIALSGNYILGVKDSILYSFDLNSHVITKLYEEKIKKYALFGEDAYLIKQDDEKVVKVNILTRETLEFSMKNVTEILVDENYIFLCIDNTKNKALYRYTKDGNNEKKLTDKENVSYIIEDDSNIFFVNKADSDKIYKVGKDGNVSKISDEVKSISDTGNISTIDGNQYMFCYNNELYYINPSDSNCLWKVNLETLQSEKVLYSPIDIMQNIEDTVFYKIKDQRGLYLYNINTKFNSEISSRLITEFVVKK